MTMELPDEEKEVLRIRFRRSKSAPVLPIPFHSAVADAVDLIAQMGGAAVLALLLKMVLKDRFTDDEVQLICDVYYHD